MAPEIKNPSVVPTATPAAVTGEINIARKTGTWLASVNDAGSSLIPGKTIGIMIPSAVKTAADVS
ncbi:MAG TPA: hypothetical protein DEQ02_06960 [Ruminococcaceae bacterium]|nr:hypothetical protein [Oscillospiraceae bacterium]